MPGLPMPRYFSKGLLVRTGRTRTSLPSCSKSSRSPGRTPRARRMSRGTVICPLLVIRACFFTGLPPHIPYFSKVLLTTDKEECFHKARLSIPAEGSGTLGYKGFGPTLSERVGHPHPKKRNHRRDPSARQKRLRMTAKTRCRPEGPSKLRTNPSGPRASRCHKIRSVGGFGAAEEFVDALGVLLGAVQDEQQFRSAAELQAFTEFVANKACGGGEGFDGALLFLFGAHDA